MAVARAQKRSRRGALEGLGGLPPEVWGLVARRLDNFDRIAFALTCKTFLEALRDAIGVGVKIRTVLTRETDDTLRPSIAEPYLNKPPNFSLDWFKVSHAHTCTRTRTDATKRTHKPHTHERTRALSCFRSAPEHKHTHTH